MGKRDYQSTDHDLEVKKNFWSYTKKFLDEPTNILPSFDVGACTAYFKKIFKCQNKKLFTIPSWMPTLPNGEKSFDLEAPSYQEISKIIWRMKSSKSPCPLDQISVIMLKRCPFLRTYLSQIIKQVWNSKNIPAVWCSATTILIHKKGASNEPSNFRPITLQPICLKIFTSIIRNRMFKFLTSNNLIENHIQKGFVPKISGTLEHTALLSHIIRDAKRKQRSLVITLLDLQNAFGEVQHGLIDTMLKYHHIPDHVIELVDALYADFKTTITTRSYATPFLKIEKGVLQGDCLSPLLFNLCINSFIRTLQTKEFEQLSYRSNKLLTPRNWFQFADDAIAISATEYENQTLVNAFSRWCNWAKMKIRPDKCQTFAMKKVLTQSKQFKPKIYVDNILIKSIEEKESFRYLGRWFNFDMDNSEHKRQLLDTTNRILSLIYQLPLHPKK